MPQNKLPINENGILDLDSILNIVICKKGEEKALEMIDDHICHMQEKLKEKVTSMTKWI